MHYLSGNFYGVCYGTTSRSAVETGYTIDAATRGLLFVPLNDANRDVLLDGRGRHVHGDVHAILVHNNWVRNTILIGSANLNGRAIIAAVIATIYDLRADVGSRRSPR